jgi:predicted metal-dependent phosphoesterase TrpH
MPVILADLHNHCDPDPQDVLTYNAFDLVDAAAEAGVSALAITPHRTVHHHPEAVGYARSRGILLINGGELMVDGRELVVLNLEPGELDSECSIGDLRKLRNRRGNDLLVIAPHPFYPRLTCAGDRLDDWIDVIDAVEWAHFHAPLWNPNIRAVRWAASRHKPVVANSDAHTLRMLGRNSTRLKVDRLDIPSVFAAIRNGQGSPGGIGPNFWTLLDFLFLVAGFQLLARRTRTAITRPGPA